MALGEAVVKIVPDTSGFADQVVKDINKSLSNVGKAADKVGDQIKESVGKGLSGVATAAQKTGDNIQSGINQGLKGVDQAVDRTSDNFKKEFKEVDKSVDKTENALRGMAKTAVAAFATGAIINFAKSALDAAEGAEVAENRLRQVVKTIGLFGKEVDVVSDRLLEYSSIVARQTGIDDEQIQAAQTKLLLFRNLAQSAEEMGGTFDRATQAAIDLSAAGFGDAAGNAMKLGRALQDPVNGLNALAKMSIRFTADEKEKIRVMVESNKIAEAQAFILETIEKKVGGTAEATATASAKMKYAFGELQEEIGKALLPAFESLTQVLIPVFDSFAKLPGDLKGFISVAVLSTAVTAGLSKGLQSLGLAAGIAKGAMGALNLVLIAASLYQQQEANNAAARIAIMDKLTKMSNDQIVAEKENLQIYMDLNDLDPAEYFRELAESQLGTAQRLVEAGVAQDVFGVSTSEATIIIGKQIQAQRQAASDTDKAAEALENAGAAADMASEQMRSYVEGLGFVVDESGEVEYSQENLAKAVEIAQKRFDDAVKAVEDYESALNDAFNAARSSIDTGFALVESQLEATNAVKEYEKAVKNGNTSQAELDKLARETAQTMLTVADNTVANAAALAAMNGESLTTAQTQEMMVTELENFRDTLDPTSPLAQYLNGFITTLNGVPSEIPVELLAEVDVAQSELEAFKTAALEIGNQITIGILRALAPLSPEFKKILDDMLRQAGKDLDFNIRINVTASGTSYVTTPYGSMPIKTQSNVTGTVSADVQPKTLSDISQYLSFADGGIFDQPQIGLFAEAGAEAIIPLTRPARALELMRDSGLLGLAQSESGAGQNFDITVVSAEPMRTAKDVVREFQALEYRMAPL